MTVQASYKLPEGVIGLMGPVPKVAPGTLPLRGDMAHIALAGRFLAAHYVIPVIRNIGAQDVILKLGMRDDSDDGAAVPSGTAIELLDQAGDWAWITIGPEGPSGYLPASRLAPDSDA